MDKSKFTGSPVAEDWDWTSRPQMSITVGPMQGVKIAFRLLRTSLVAAVRRTTVTFDVK